MTKVVDEMLDYLQTIDNKMDRTVKPDFPMPYHFTVMRPISVLPSYNRPIGKVDEIFNTGLAWGVIH